MFELTQLKVHQLHTQKVAYESLNAPGLGVLKVILNFLGKERFSFMGQVFSIDAY